ncbi:MAG: hypothetical protein WDN72_00440 [Alphaproteobacteria bacterium]
MAFGAGEQAAIIELMNGKYARILEVETQWSIRLTEGDMRARIEHFHDAVRALTSGSASLYEKHSRLSVEHLAYDLSLLRQVPGRPVGSINRATDKSLSSALVKKDEAGASHPKLPPAAVRAEITQLYRDYTVFFAALFAEVADKNYQSRVDAIDESVADIGLIEEVLNALIAGTMNAAQAMHELMHVERDDLRERIQALLAKKKLTAAEKQQALSMLGTIEKGLDKERKSIEQSHMNYATGQLAVYEDSKETMKRLAGAGLNLAGKFVQNAMQAATQGKGRGI